jgi:hypothetical protein
VGWYTRWSAFAENVRDWQWDLGLVGLLLVVVCVVGHFILKTIGGLRMKRTIVVTCCLLLLAVAGQAFAGSAAMPPPPGFPALIERVPIILAGNVGTPPPPTDPAKWWQSTKDFFSVSEAVAGPVTPAPLPPDDVKSLWQKVKDLFSVSKAEAGAADVVTPPQARGAVAGPWGTGSRLSTS